jgi:hypothetical protein
LRCNIFPWHPSYQQVQKASTHIIMSREDNIHNHFYVDCFAFHKWTLR